MVLVPLTMAYIGRLQYERVSGISLVVVYKRDTETVISVNKGLSDAFYGCEKVEKLFWFCDLFIFLRQCCYSSQRGSNVVN